MNNELTFEGKQIRVEGRLDLPAAHAVERLLSGQPDVSAVDLSRADSTSDVALAELARAVREMHQPIAVRLVGLNQRQYLLLHYLGLDPVNDEGGFP
jgi:ABC-type transporter Mla MlaB component